MEVYIALVRQYAGNSTDLTFDVRYLIGFGAGCAFASGTIWRTFVVPLKAEIKELRRELSDFTKAVMRKAGFYDV